ncbi:PKD domain-containing protein [Carboxylicivirga sediminis]|uniref:PKD domain-containing protein n=1 Tax=Carboxylicivirga sediminis TaxID=2006564 RepID=A0A941F884_9BACT|nr:PKD domain-containing protein [Carboxylicivirga sediminis]MBR8537563.1 PKD domain-containing protein [Carboxylicivirga sediminis]
MGVNTQALIGYRLKKRMASSMLILVLLLISGVKAVGQIYQYDNKCTGGVIYASEVLANAIGAGANIPLADQTGGVFVTSDPDLILAGNDENAIIYGTKDVGGGQRLDWIVNGITYRINIKKLLGSAGAPIVIDFYTNTPDVCTIPYNAIVYVTIQGGSSFYDITITDETNAVISELFNVSTNITNYPINLGNFSIDKTFTIKAVSDGGACVADVSAVMPVSFTASNIPQTYQLQDINGNTYATGCSSSGVDLYLSNSEDQVTYNVYSGGTHVLGPINGNNTGNQLFLGTVNTIGITSYYVEATHNGSGCQTTMGNMTVNLSNAPVASIAPGTVFEKCFGAPDQFDITLNISPIDQGPWNVVITDGTNDYAFVANTYDDAWRTPNIQATTTFTIKSIVDKNGCVNTVNNGSAQITVNPKPAVTLVGPDRVCMGNSINLGTSVAPVGIVIVDYDWSTGAKGPGLDNINVTPSIQPIHTYDVTVTSDKGCIGSAVKNITVNSLPAVSFTSPKYTFCQDDPSVTLSSVPAAGGSYNIGSAVFDPSIMPVGSQSVTYTYTDVTTGCTNSDTKLFTVNPVPNVSITGLNASYCADAGVLTMQGNPPGGGAVPFGSFTCFPNGGFFNDNGDGTADFNTVQAVADQGPGDYYFSYTAVNSLGCDATATESVTINADLNATVNYTGLANFYCGDDPTQDVTLTGNVPGDGIFTILPAWAATGADAAFVDNGNGTATFNPYKAGGGTFDITYEYTDATGCTGRRTYSTTVGATLVFDLDGQTFCQGDPVQTLSATPVGGYFSIEAPDGTVHSPIANGNSTWFDPTTRMPGIYQISYRYDNGTGCLTSQTYPVEIKKAPYPDFSIEGTGKYCEQQGPVKLTKVTTNPGVFTGTGVTEVSNVYYFNPDIAGEGIHTITFTTDSLGCRSTKTMDVEVVTSPVLDIQVDPSLTYCDNEPGVVIEGLVDGTTSLTGNFTSATNPGGDLLVLNEYAAEGIGLNDGKGWLYPGVGPGNYAVTYIYENPGNGCIYQHTENIQILQSDGANFNGISDGAVLCQGTGIVNLYGLLPNGGTGRFPTQNPADPTPDPTADPDKNTGVINSGALDGEAYFDTRLLSPGNYTLLYEYTNAAGCTNYSEKNFTIVEGPVDVYQVTGGGAYCVDDPVATKGVFIGIDGSTAGVTYELRLGGTPVQTKTGPAGGGPMNFDNRVTDVGTYSVWARLGGCEAPMSGNVNVELYDLLLQLDGVNAVKHVTCFGANDGEVKLVASGGSGNYTFEYSLNGGAWTVNPNTTPDHFINLVPGNYQFRITDQSGTACALPAGREVNVTINSAAAALNVVYTQLSKNGCDCSVPAADCDGAALLTISGGTKYTDLVTYPSGYLVEWPATVTNLSADLLTATHLSEGTYTVNVTDANGCTSSVIVTIEKEADLTLVLNSQDDNQCFGVNTAKARITATGGSGQYQYSYDGGTNWTLPTASTTYETGVLATGNHNILVRDSEHPHCTAGFTVTIVGPASGLVVGVTPAGETCVGDADGYITLNITGGTAPYRYQMDGAGAIMAVPANFEIHGISNGAHTITILDDNNCSVNEVFTIAKAPVIDLSGVVTNATCDSSNDGKVVLTANPANVNYVYSIDAGANWQSSPVFDFLSAGTYNFIVQDNVKGCTAVLNNLVVADDPAIAINPAAAIQHVVCFGEANGSFTAVATGGQPTGSFEYAIATDAGGNPIYQDSPIFSSLPAATYDLWVRNKGTLCEVYQSDYVVINNPAAPLSVSLNSKTDIECVGGNTGEIDIDVNDGWPGYTYQWRNKATNENFGTTQDLNAVTAGKRIAGATYEVVVTDNQGCTFTFEETVTEPSAWNATVSTTPNTITNAATDPAIIGNGTAALSPVSGGSDPATYTYEWFDSSNTSIATGVMAISNLDPGNYYVMITGSAAGCDHRVDFVIGDTTVPLAFDLAKVDAACYGENGKLIVSITGGTPDYTIQYQRNADPVQSISGTSANYHEIAGAAGTYLVTVLDNSGGTVTQTITIIQPDAFTVSGIENYDNCEAAIDVTISETDDYRVTWVVPAGAPAIAVRTINSGNSFTESGLTYAGDYIVTVENIASGCIQSDIITLREPKLTVVEDLTQHKDLLCNAADNGYLAVSVTGREPGHVFNYIWQNVTTGAPSIDTGSTPSIGSAHAVDAGVWQVTVTSSDNCVAVLGGMIITEPDALTLSDPLVKNITTCSSHDDGQVEVSVSGGTAPYTVTVTNGTITRTQTLSVSAFIFTDLPAGSTYTVSVIDDNTCAPVTKPFVITAPQAVSVTNVDGTISCYGPNDGIISFDITGGVQDASNNHNVYDLVITGDNGFNLGTQIDVLAIPSYTYSLPGLAPGTYTIKVWDNLATVDPASGCPNPAYETSVTLSHLEVTESIINKTCPGGIDNGSIELTIIGSGNYMWVWTYPNGTTVSSPGIISQYNLAAGTYTLSLTDVDRGCPLPPLTYTVDYDRQVEITNWELKDVDCYNQANGSITNITHTATVPPVYTWTGVAAGNENLTEQTNLDVGFYQLEIREPGTGCSAIETFEIKQPDNLHFNLLNTLSCSPFNQRIYVDGLVGGNGVIANYTYRWIGPDGNLLPDVTDNIDVTQEGLYTVTVTDELGKCSLTKSISIEGEMSVVITKQQHVSCFGLADGAIEVSILGGPSDRQFVYNWEVFDGTNWVNTGAPTANASLTNITKGTYRVVVSAVDAINYPCSVTSSDIVITEPLEIQYVNINPINITTCSSAATGAIELAVTGGSGVYYLDYTGDNVTDLVSNDGLFRVDNLTAGLYQLRLSDSNGCVTNPVIEDVPVTAPDPLVLTIDNVATTIDCETEGTGAIVFDIRGGNKDGSGNPHYQITVTGETPRDVYAEGTESYSDLSSGTYVIKVVDMLASTQSACTQLEETVTLELLTVDGLVINNTCASTSNNVGAIRNITISGSTNYDWQWDEVNGDVVSDNNSLNQENLAAGTYILNVTDNDRACTISKEFIVGEDITLNITGVAVPVTCYGANDGKISGVNITGTVDYTFNWSGPGPVDNTRIDGQENLEPGSYLLEVIDNTNGCRVNQTWLIEESPEITYDLEFVVESCEPYERGINVLNPSGGNTSSPADFSYTWRGPGNVVYNGQNLTGLTVGGIYTVTVADNNCSVTKSIDVPKELVITPTITELNCNGNVNGAIAISITGGSGNFSYQWTRNGVAYSNNLDISGLDAATYELTVTDNTETDGSNCTYIWSYDLNAPAPIIVTGTATDIICNGDANGQIAINVSGGSGIYTYNWTTVDGSGLVPANQNQTGLSGGTYTVVVEDSKGCVSAPFDFTVNELEAIDFTFIPTDADCDGANGAIDVTPSGGSGTYAYHWSASDGGVVSAADKNQEDLSGLVSGTYTLKVWDADPLENRTSCFIEKTIQLTKPITIEPTVKNQTCAGTENGEIGIIVNGGTAPYSFVWSTADGNAAKLDVNAQNQSELSPGTYTVEITDSRTVACVKSFDIVVGIDSNIEIISNVSPVNCNGGTDGSITLVQVSGGLAGNYSYNWTGSGTGIVQGQRNQSGLSAGNYVVTVTDDDTGCNVQEAFKVNEPSVLSVSVDNLVDVLCKGDLSGEIRVVASGGTPFIDGVGDPYYEYVWIGPSANLIQDSDTQTGLVAGNYSVTVKDANGCSSATLDIEIQEPATTLSATLDNVIDVSATGGNDGQIFITVSGGTGGKNIAWTGIDLLGNPIPGITQNTVNPRDLVAGTYKVVITDDNGCDVTIDGIVVEEPNMPLTMTVLIDHIKPCHGDGNGAISVTANGGTSPYIITLYDAGNNVIQTVNADALSQSNLAAAVYRVEISDNGGNTISRNDLEITEPSPLVITATVTQHVDCYNASTGAMNFRVDGGVPDASGYYKVTVTGPQGYRSELDNIEEGIDYPLNNLPAGAYWLSVIDDSNGDGAFVLSDNCSAPTTATINQLSAIVDVDNDVTICVGQSAALQLTVSNYPVSAANPLDVTLSDGTTATLTGISTIVNVTPIATTVYSVVDIEDGSGCPKGPGNNGSSATVIVNEQPIAQLSLVGDGEICEGETASLRIRLVEGVSPWSVTYTDGVTSTTLNNINTADRSTIVNVSPVSNTTYSLLSVTDDNGCSGLVAGTVDIIVNESPSVTMAVSGNTTICQGTASALEFTFPTGSPDYSVTISENGVNRTFNATPLVGNVYTLPVSPVVTTNYQLVAVADSKGCSVPISSGTTLTINVENNPADAGVITGDMLACQGSTGTYSVGAIADADSYLWTVPATMGTIVTGNGTNTITVEFLNSFTGSGLITVSGVNSCTTGVSSTIGVTASLLPAKPNTPTGPINICEEETGLRYRIDPVTNASSYTWSIPEGLDFVGDNTGTEIELEVKPAYNNFVGEVKVTATNACGDGLESDPLLVTVSPLPVVNAGTDEFGVCASTHQLNAIDPGAGFTGQWTVTKGTARIVTGEENLFNANVTGISHGENTFVWTVTNNATGCFASDEVSFYNDQVVISASADNNHVCNGEVTVTGTPVYADASHGYWTVIVGSGNIETPSAPTTRITNLGDGLNTIEWTIVKNGCESKATVDVFNNQPTMPVIYDKDGNPATVIDLVCGENFTDISATAPVLVGEVGTWRVVSGSANIGANPNAANINVTDVALGETTITYTMQNGSCIEVATVVLRNNKLNVFAGDDVTQCDDTFTLDATVPEPGVTGQWSIPAGMGTGVFSNGNSATATVSNLGRGANTLRWTLTKNGCESFDEIVITNNSSTVASVGAAQTICAYEAVLTGNTPSAAMGERGFWSVIKGSGTFDDVNAPDTNVTGLAHGENIFRWTIVHNGCSSSADLIVNNLHVDVYAGKDTIICGKTVTLNANTPLPGHTGEWSLIAGEGGGTFKPEDINNPSILIGGLDYGRNGFVWTINNAGCTSSDSIFVTNDNPYYLDSNGDKREISAGDPIYVNSPNAVMVADTPESPGTGIWSLVLGGGDIDNPTNPGTLITNLRQGESIFRWTVTNGTCSYFSDVTITNGAVEQANAGQRDTTCTGEIKLNANEPINALGEWSVLVGNGNFEDKTKFNTVVTNLDKGENHFVWTLYNGSTQSKDTVVIVNNIVAQAYAGLDKAICNTDTFELSAIAPEVGRGTVQWSVVSGGGLFDDVASPSTIVRDLGQGANVLKYRISLGKCYTEAYITISNNTPTTPDAGEDQVICTDSIQLLPNTPAFGTGKWSVASGYADPDPLLSDWAKKLAPGENLLVWTIDNENCKLSDTIKVQNNQPSIAFAGHDREVCESEVVLSANNPEQGVGHWELVAGSGTITDATDRNTLVTGLGNGVNRFRWIIDNNGCISTDEVDIHFNLIEAFAGYDDVICEDYKVLSANAAFPGTGTWGVEAGAGTAIFDDPSDPYTTVRGLQPGPNELLWTINYGGCSSTSKVIITNDSPSPAFAGDNQSLCVSNSTVLSANDPARGDGEWTILNGSGSFSSMIEHNPTVTDLAFGDNIFRWTVTHNSCVSEADVMVSFNRIDAFAGDNKDLCSDEVQLAANTANPGVGTWTIVGGTSQAVFEDINNPNSKVSNLAKGANVLRWTVNYRGCETKSEVVMTNNSPSKAYAGNLQELCIDNTTLDATIPMPGVGEWDVLMGSGTIAEVNNAKTAVTGLSKGDNVFRWTVTNGVCTSIDEVRIINNEPSVPYAGKDEESCQNFMNLKAEAPTFGSGLWSIEQGGGNFDDPTSPTATITNLNPGTNILRWTITQGQCELSHSITVTNNAAAIANAGPDVQDCKDWSQLDANIPQTGLGIGEWSLVSGKGDFDDISGAKTTIRNLGFGENILMWTITNGACFSSDQVTIFNKTPDQAAAGDDRTTCEDYIVLNANIPVDGVGEWTVVSGSGAFDDATKYNTMVTGVGYGENIYKWTIAYGDCVTEDVVVITSNKAYPFAGEDDVTYEPEYAMQAQNPGSFNGVWSVVAGGGTFDDPNFFNTTVRNLPAGKSTFRWTITTDGCEAYDDVIIEYKEVPEAGFTVNNEAGCFPLEVKFTNYSVGGSAFTWEFGDGGTTTERSPVYTYQNPGTYTAVLTVAGPDGNDAIYTQQIIVHDHPVADFNVGPEIVYLPQDEIRCYDMSVDAASWFWEFGDGQTSTEQNPSYTYAKEGVYSISLTVQNEFGCENRYTQSDAVTALLSGFIEFPNAFKPRPGGAGNSGTIGERNDAIFKPKHRDVEVYHIQIFNRWGQLIFESHNVEEGWDGNYKGQLAPQAVYVYKVAGKFTNGREFSKAGSILLVR